MSVSRVLIYRLGSLGDTVVALPCFHLVERAFSQAERRLLSNEPVSGRAAPAGALLDGSGLVHSYMSYPMGLRSPAALCALAAGLRRWRPDVLVYLAEPRSLLKLARDVLFFRASGVRRIVGLPWRRDHRRHRRIAGRAQLFESEASRLARSLGALGDARCEDPASWDLRLSGRERARARALLSHGGFAGGGLLACGMGTKVEANQWGAVNWRSLLSLLARRHPGLGLALVGAAQERAASERAAAGWLGPVLNLCGVTSPRETAAVLQDARVFIGHDSGPLHLAAAVGTRCVAIFGARNPPGVWFPCGDGHRVIRHRVPCEGCGLERCVEFQKRCIASITIGEVYGAVCAALDDAPARTAPGREARL